MISLVTEPPRKDSRTPYRNSLRIAALGALVALIFFNADASEFQHPWREPDAALVIDPYHANTLDWNQLKLEPKVIAIIHKATIGTSDIDPSYLTRKDAAKSRGYLWGSYHWGTAGNPERQADFYIDTVKPAVDELIALDLEDPASKTLMNAAEALRFIKRVKERLGRFPVLYSNDAGVRLISKQFQETEFAHVPLWYARYRSTIVNFPTGVWGNYVLWQFSSEILPQIVVRGTKPDMDVSVAHGTPEDLRKAWPFT